MQASAGVTAVSQGFEGQVWNILDQIYVPKHVSDHSFSWHATLPADSFVPLHVHPTQDEFLYLIEGKLEFVLDKKDIKAGAGDLVSLPLGIPHSIHNRSGSTVKCLFWVSPTRMLYDYFKKINNVRDIPLLMKLAGEHEVPFIDAGTGR
jgi:mannose-6-phosphate isomerase-like protein (cupin superfamily)